jgi:hypothetical protein
VKQVSIRRVLVALGLVLAVGFGLVVFVVGGWLIWGSWVSPMEKRAMTVALDRIDEVANCEVSDQQVCEKRLEAARTAILVCQKKEFTAYDKQLVPVLDMQLDGAQAERETRSKASTDKSYGHKLEVLLDSNRETEAMLRTHLQ